MNDLVNYIKGIIAGYKNNKAHREEIAAVRAFEREYMSIVTNQDNHGKGYNLNDHFKQEAEALLAKDTRYNEPKGKPQVPQSEVDGVIDSNDIYSRAKEMILNAQREQVAYGLEKYPEPLNADTWSILETIDHAISEKVDDLHYTMMLRIKLEKELTKPHIVVYADNEPIERTYDSTYGYSSGFDTDNLSKLQATTKHIRHGKGKCWCGL